MAEAEGTARRRQFCARCGQFMFEFYRSPDGHYGLVGEIATQASPQGLELRCPTCGTRYCQLDRVDIAGQPVARY
jgi:DNA-directed RNA polymerase subunit RPC12/RpoP